MPWAVGILYFPGMKFRGGGYVMLALFFCSGGTALVYEVIWSKFLSQMFGSTIYAQTVVLAVFMGGLALGNKILGRWADGLKQPLQTYGYLEIAIGVYAFLFLSLDQFADRLFVAVGSHILAHTMLLLAWKGVLSVLLLLGPTMLMGGTLPLIAAWLQQFSAEAGRRSALFYAVNSLGAVAGAGLAGFWLVQNLGLVATLQMTGLANVLIGAAAGWLSRKQFSQGSNPAAAPAENESTGPAALSWRMSCAVVALTGAVAMGMEVLASRSLAMIFGSSLQSFAVVLMAFILGIGLGSAWIASVRRTWSDQKLIVLLLCLAATWVSGLVFNLERLVDVYRMARTGIATSSVGYDYYQLFTTGVSLVVLGLPAACTGAVLPLMIRASGTSLTLGTRVGALLTANTLGSVAGTLLAGFVLMPLVGLRDSCMVLVLVLACSALAVALHSRWRAGGGLAAVVLVFAVSLLFTGGDSWRWVMSSGVFRGREKEFSPTAMPLRKQHVKILFYDDAPDATVSVEEGDAVVGSFNRCLRTNGKPEATSKADFNTQMLIAHLPLLTRPEAKDVFVFGLGSGISVGAVRSYPGVTNITIAENCEPVVKAAKFFNEWNRNILDDPRTRLWHEDARTVLELSPQDYDVIIAQPSNPWTAGIGSVFSQEFYRLAANRLKPGGIMVQWFHLYEMHDGIVELVLRTFRSVFPNIEIWDSCDGDIIMLGSLQPWESSPEIFAKNFSLPGVREDFAKLGINSPEALFARQLASQRTGFAVTGPGPVQCDLFPVLEYAAPYAFYLGKSSHLLEKYDERTHQELLAPAAKNAMLHALPGPDIRSVFATYASVNGELLDAMHDIPSAVNIPCILNPKSPRISVLPVLGTNMVALSLYASALGSTPEQTLRGIAGIESILAVQPAGNNPVAADWASLAATAALGLDDEQPAARLSVAALKFDPDNEQAAYLLRILNREAPALFKN